MLSFTMLAFLAKAVHLTPYHEDALRIEHSGDEEKQWIKIVDIPEGPSAFVIAGMSYLDKSAYCEVNLEAFQTGRLGYSLSSVTGEILYRDHKRLHPGMNNLGLSLANCPNGIYQLDMTFEQEEKILIIEKTAENRIKASLVSPMK